MMLGMMLAHEVAKFPTSRLLESSTECDWPGLLADWTPECP